jgi:hypothetical protein
MGDKMPFFMITIDGEVGLPGSRTLREHTFEVEALTSGAALVRALEELDAIQTERVLRVAIVSQSYESPTTAEEMAAWPPDDHFKRLTAGMT